MNVGIILKNMRTKAKISQKEMGKRLSLSDTTISSYERGNSQPDFETIIKFAKICGFQFQIVNNENHTISLEDFSREI